MTEFEKMHATHFNYTSTDFQGKVIDICTELVRSEIAERVRGTGFFAIIADETKSSKTKDAPE